MYVLCLLVTGNGAAPLRGRPAVGEHGRKNTQVYSAYCIGHRQRGRPIASSCKAALQSDKTVGRKRKCTLLTVLVTGNGAAPLPPPARPPCSRIKRSEENASVLCLLVTGSGAAPLPPPATYGAGPEVSGRSHRSESRGWSNAQAKIVGRLQQKFSRKLYITRVCHRMLVSL